MNDEIKRLNKELSVARKLNRQYQDKEARKEQEKNYTRNLDFVQVERSYFLLTSELARENITALQVLFLLIQAMNKNNEIKIDYEILGKVTKKSRSTLSKAIKHLADNKWLFIMRDGVSNVYVINHSIFWTNDRDKKNPAFKSELQNDKTKPEKDIRFNKEYRSKKLKLKRRKSAEENKEE
jgi:hypothetical protein